MLTLDNVKDFVVDVLSAWNIPFTKLTNVPKGLANGFAELDAAGKVPASQLPSYVDDVIEGYYDSDMNTFFEDETEITSITPESGKIYVDISSSKSYRWSGSTYVRVDDVDLTGYQTKRLDTPITVSGSEVTTVEDALNAINDKPSGSGGGSAEYPSGGTTGQVLAKASDDDNDVEWADAPEAMTEAEVQEIKDAFSAKNTSPFATAYTKYSTEEQVVGEWIDGKKIYQRVVDLGTNRALSEAMNIGITASDIGVLIEAHILLTESSSNVRVSTPVEIRRENDNSLTVRAFAMWGGYSTRRVILVYSYTKN